MAEPIIKEIVDNLFVLSPNPFVLSLNPYTVTSGMCLFAAIYYLNQKFETRSSPDPNPEKIRSVKSKHESSYYCSQFDRRNDDDNESDEKILSKIVRDGSDVAREGTRHRYPIYKRRNADEEQARHDFRSLSGASKGGIDSSGKYECIKMLQDGMTAILRNHSRDGRPTVEIQQRVDSVTNKLYKIRYEKSKLIEGNNINNQEN
jgi:hypothetical protein